MVSNVAEQCTQPSSKSLSYAQNQNIILVIALVSGHNSRYSIQMRRKRQCSFLPPLKQRGIHYTFYSASLWTHDLHSFYDMKFPKDGTPCSRSSTADKALKGMKFAMLMPLTPLTPSLPVLQISLFLSSPYPAFSTGGLRTFLILSCTFHNSFMVRLHLAFWSSWLCQAKQLFPW